MRRISRRAMVSGSLVAAITTGLGVAALSGAGGSSTPPGPYPRGFDDDGAVTYGSGSRVVDIWTDFSCSHCAQLTWDNQSVITSLLESRTISLRIHPVSILGQRWTLMAGGPWAKVVSTQKDASLRFHLELSGWFRSAWLSDDASRLTDDAVYDLATRAGVRDKSFKDAPTSWYESADQAFRSKGLTSVPVVMVDGKQVSLERLAAGSLKDVL